ncbi:Orotidine 5'-phosphate decarboxylase [Alkalibacterium sp. AK22]|uniref:orotidine-5'-phosphate decarboxylase n=1 Tax=Alkalibacterium sp. AK22 TaxID=1229520 RepID=UPI00044CC410|nr:orotidine-5'-phosphate decarboxylase [Alkalibacterium sp. AK22]EXJ24258.1 Orotidine 5'-phosphate decarboxylase [Alkalibacterium sp. AK22]
MDNKPIIALDFSDISELEDFLSHFSHEQLSVKVGMELFYSQGPQIIQTIKEKEHAIFLDLKLHDIPNTVKRAMASLSRMGVDMVNIHAAGGQAMMEAAREGVKQGTPAGQKEPILLAVTQLTSTSQEQMRREQATALSVRESVLHYARLAYNAGVDGVVCSALEAASVCSITDQSFLRVTPGIRPEGSEKDDQSRVLTPFEAKQAGATHIVVGRPVIQAQHPFLAYESVFKEWKGEISDDN